MNTDRVFALHITWTCYGNWLPGDRRGYVSNTPQPNGGFESKQNTPGMPYTADHTFARARARALQKWPSVRLSAEQAMVAAEALVGAAQARDWYIAQAALMTNHVHVVITQCPPDGEAVRRVLKGNSQAVLSKHAGGPRRWWTAGGSDRYKNDAAAVAAAIDYVARQPGMLAMVVDMQVRRADS